MRPTLRYHGGKYRIAPWVISHFPPHKIYVEPFGGAASVLLRKPRAYAEVYNDLDAEIVNVFHVLRDHGEVLQERLQLTPFARAEYAQAYEPTADAVERARRTIIKSFMGFGSDAIRNKSGFRANSNRSGTTPAHDWKNYADTLSCLVERLRDVIIEQRDAAEVIQAHDSPDTLFYVDPPYLHSTRQSSKRYKHEMSDADHRALAKTLHNVSGKVIVSGYHSPLYAKIYKGWRVVDTPALADGARKRTEVLWMNFSCTNLFT